MSKPLIFGEPDIGIEDAARLMFWKKIKKLLPMRMKKVFDYYVV